MLFKNAKERLCSEAKRVGWFKSVKGFSPTELTVEFRQKFKDILACPRGGGYWIWKYDIIQQTLQTMADGDVLVYLDAGCTINPHGKKRFDEYIHMLDDEHPIVSFQTSHLEYQYTTRQIFEYLGVTEREDITRTGQIVGGILVMKKTQKMMDMLDIWGKALDDDPLLFTDHYNAQNKVRRNGFIDNRHEQSVFSVIRKKYGTVLLKDETWFVKFGNAESKSYPFWATRKKN